LGHRITRWAFGPRGVATPAFPPGKEIFRPAKNTLRSLYGPKRLYNRRMSDEPTPSLSEAKCASLRDRGYGACDYPPLSPLAGNLMSGRPSSRAPRFPAKLGTLEIQRVLPETGRGSPLVLVWGWPTPIRMNARTEFPPLPRHPVYGPAAREEALRLKREAKRERINLGWFTQINLGRVAKKERPLSYSVWERTQAYMKRVRRERKHEQDVRERPLQFRVVPGQGPMVGWRRGSPN
jgi:hypothetical protein